MKITASAIQFNPKCGDIEHNLAKIEFLIKSASAHYGMTDTAGKGVGLVVLPEICDIGYDLKFVKKLATELPNDSTKRFSEMAKQNNTIIVAGMADKTKDGLFNASVVFDTKGKVVAKYYKTHLCPVPPFNEPKEFKYGNEFVLVDVGGIKLGLTICYDIRFPEVYRSLMLKGAQIIAHPSAFPKSRIDQLEMCARVRALENQFFIVVSNYCGIVGGNELGGRSLIANPDGELLAKATDQGEAVICAEIDLDYIEHVRKEKPIISERRVELYKSPLPPFYKGG